MLSENLTSGLEQVKHGLLKRGQNMPSMITGAQKSFAWIGLGLNKHFLCRNGVDLQFPQIINSASIKDGGRQRIAGITILRKWVDKHGRVTIFSEWTI